MTLDQFLEKLKQNPKAIAFSETMAVIDENFNFTPSAFKNGTVENAEGQNSGSCKLFAFAKLQDLSKEEALACFCEHYQNVLQDPTGDSHQNIRNFMKTGFDGLSFDKEALSKI